jgi:hypothetical protein
MLYEHSSAPFNPRPSIPTSNPCLFCDASNISTAPSCAKCKALTLPTFDNATDSQIEWTTFSLHRDHPSEAKQYAFAMWEAAMEGTTSFDRTSLFATKDKSKNGGESKNDDASEHGKGLQNGPMSMLFHRLPGGLMKLCVQHGKKKPVTTISNKEEAIRFIRDIAGLE